MNPRARRVQRTYLILTLGETLAGSFIWGINTLFLLDAGLTNLEAFAANAFFTAGMVLFEVPTGVVADTWGRRASYLLGALTLAIATLGYWLLWLWHGPFVAWAAMSMVLGLGFTFFSGAVEAWLVDALAFAGYDGELEPVFGRAQTVSGVAMLVGSVAGGFLAQATSLGVPFLVRAGVLLALFAVAFFLMKDEGFTPEPSTGPVQAVRRVLRASIEHGLAHRPVRWVMLAAPFASGAGIFAFYAVQPYLLELAQEPDSYSIAGLAAALVAGTQIVGGLLAPRIRARFEKRTSVLLLTGLFGAVALVLLGVTASFWVALALIAGWALFFAAGGPIRRAYLNDMIPSSQRATVLSFDSLMGSSGGVVLQPALGRVADVWSYAFSLVLSGVFALIALPFLYASRREGHAADATVRPAPPG